MQALLVNRWSRRALLAAALAAAVPAVAPAAWPWTAAQPPAPAIPVGPPIYAPSPAPVVVGYQPGVPAATVRPSLVPSTAVAAPATTYAPPATTYVAPAPAVAAPVVAAPTTCPTCAAPRVTGYVPPTYRTNWVQVPVTTYRPVVAVDPATGLPINAVQPCTTTTWQARRMPNSLWGGLWPSSSPPPSVVAYTPATIAAYPGTVTNYAPYAPPATIIAPNVRTSNYAPIYSAPVVTNYAPVYPAPTVTNYAPAAPVTPPVTTYQAPPATSAAPTTPAPYCPPTTSAPATSYPPTGSQGYVAPPATTGEAASVAPRIDLPSPPTTRNFRELDNEPVVPVTPPERRIIEAPPPVIEGPRIQQPQGSNTNARPISPYIPFARPEKPASTTVPERNLRLVPDPDATKLDLRKDEIPNLIKPGDRRT